MAADGLGSIYEGLAHTQPEAPAVLDSDFGNV